MSSTPSTEAPGLRPWHFFAVIALAGATAAVLVARDGGAVALALVALAVVAAGGAGLTFHQALWSLVASEGDGNGSEVRGRARAALEREKLLVLRSIKELEFDRAMGKVAEPDFAEMVARLRARAIGLMKQLDERPAAYRDLIDREVQRRLGERAPQAAALPGDAALGAEARCSECGTRNDGDARFCKGCGHALA